MFERFKHRSYELERLDTGDYTPAEYRRWQQEMRFIHSIFGEVRALRRTLFRDLERTNGPVSALDVGAGSGSLLRELRKWTSERAGLFVGVEINHQAALSIDGDRVAAVEADALRLPFADDSFDFVYCTLLLHHLGDDDAIRMLAEMRRVAKKRIYVIDLNRDPLSYYVYKTVGRLALQRFTVEDGALSILRSFTADELHRLASAAGLSGIKVERSQLNRLILSGS